MPDAAAPTLVNCFHCGRSVDPSEPACPHCATSFRRLCPCDVEVNAFAETCPECGLLQHPPQYKAPIPLRRIVFFVGLALLMVAGTLVWFLQERDDRQELEPWRLKQRAVDAFAAGRMKDARADVAAVLDRTPSDARAWYLLAVIDRDLGLPAADYRASAEQALAHDPALAEALTFLALEARIDGDLDRARALVERAATQESATTETWRLLAELELERPDADSGRALAALEKAYVSGERDVRLLSQRAVLRIRLLGYAPPSRYPEDVKRALDEADAAISRLDPRERDALELVVLRAEILVGLGRHSAALDLLKTALGNPRVTGPDLSDDDTTLRARLLLVAARAHHVAGQPQAALSAIEEALDLQTGGAVPSRVAQLLLALRQPDAARALLRDRADRDPDGSIALALVQECLARGDLELARTWLERAEAQASEAPRLRLIQAELLRREGDLAGARRALENLVEDPSLREIARLNLALLALDHPGSLSERQAAVSASIVALQQSVDAAAATTPGAPSRPSPDIRRSARAWSALGRLQLAAGLYEDAKRSFDAAVELEPWTPSHWIGVGRATTHLDLPHAGRDAATAFAHAAALRPHDAALVNLVARAQILNGDPARAVGTCTVYLNAHPDDAAVRVTRSEALRALGHWKSAASDLRALADLDASRGPDWNGPVLSGPQLRWLVIAHQRSDRLDLIRDLIKKDRSQGRPERAQFLEGCVAEATGTSKPDVDLDQDSVTRAAALLGDGDQAAALAMVERLLRADPSDADAVQFLVFATFAEGATEALRERAARALSALPSDTQRGMREFLAACLDLSSGEAESAVERLRRVAAYRPHDPAVAFFHGQALFAAGRRDAALPRLRVALLLDGRAESPFRVPIAQRFTTVAAASDDPVRREQLLAEAVSLDPRQLEATLRLFDAYNRRTAFPEAASIVERRLAVGGLDDATRHDLLRRALAARLAEKNLSAALPHLEQLGREDATDATTAALRGWVLIQSGKFEEAQRHFRESLSADPANRAATLGMLRALIRLGDIQTARTLVANWREAVPDDASLSPLLVNHLVEAGRLTEAATEAREAVARAPNDTNALIQLTWIHELSDQPDAAQNALRSRLKQADEAARPELQLLLAGTLIRGGAPAADIHQLLRGLEPTSPAVAKATPHITPEHRHRSRLLRAELAIREGDSAMAKSSIARFIETWPAVEPASSATTDPVPDSAVAANPDPLRIIQRQPASVIDSGLEHRVRFVQGVLAAGDGDLSAAAAYFQRALLVSPTHDASLNNLAWCLSQDPNTTKLAVDMARAATRIRAGNPDYWDTRATCEQAADLQKDALQSFQKAATLYAAEKPQRAEVRAASALRLARLLRRSGRDDEAVSVARGILRYAPDGASGQAARAFLVQ